MVLGTLRSRENVTGIWAVPIWVGDAVSYPLVLDELFRAAPRLDREQVLAHGLRERNERARAGRVKLDQRKLTRDELDQVFDQTIRSWRRMVRPFHKQLEDAVGEHIELERKAVERRAQMICPPYRLRLYTTRNKKRTVYAQVAEDIEERIGAELVDLLRLAPKLQRCPRCGRIFVRRCGGFLARGEHKLEDCEGHPMPLATTEEREKQAMRKRRSRYRATYGPDALRTQKLEAEYAERFPPRPPGPKHISGDDLLP